MDFVRKIKALIRKPPKSLLIKMEDINNSNRGPVYVGDRKRLATVTSVKLLDKSTLACCHFVGRKIYLVEFDIDVGTYRTLDSTDTVFNQKTTETDLCDDNGHGLIATSNFYDRTFSEYQRNRNKITFVRDLPFVAGIGAHGVKYYKPDVLAVTCREPPGVYFFDTNSLQLLLHIKCNMKTQDACFLSDSKMVVVTTDGTPTSKERKKMYRSQVHLVDFNLKEKKYEFKSSVVFENAHHDCVVAHGDNVYVTDQFNNSVLVLNSENLNQVDQVTGYDFPHGIDIKFNLLAVSNYGSNTVDLRRL